MSAGRPGLFGKLPAKGDFLTRDLPAPVLQAFEGWLQQVMACARNDAGPHWQGAWAAAPVWRFWIGPDVFGTACAGAMMTSRDRVGRLFPLIFILPDRGRDFPPPPVIDPGEGWYALLEGRLREAFALDDLPDPAALLEGLGPDEVPEWAPPEAAPVPAMAEEVASEDAIASAPPPDPAIWDSAAPAEAPQEEDEEAPAEEGAEEAPEAPAEAAPEEAAGKEGRDEEEPATDEDATAADEDAAAAEEAEDEDAESADEETEDGTEEDGDTAEADAEDTAEAAGSPPAELPEGDDSPFDDAAFVPPDPGAFPDFPPMSDPEPEAAPEPEPLPELVPEPMPGPAAAPAPAATPIAPGPAGPAPELWPSLPRRDDDPVRALWAMAEGDDPVSLLADVAGADHLRAAARRTYWWTNGGGRGPAAVIAVEGMPDSAAFGLLIRGGR